MAKSGRDAANALALSCETLMMSEQKAEAEKLIAHTDAVAASAALADIALAKSNTEAVAALGVAAAATAVALELSNKNAEEAKNLSDRNVQVQTQIPTHVTM